MVSDRRVYIPVDRLYHLQAADRQQRRASIAVGLFAYVQPCHRRNLSPHNYNRKDNQLSLQEEKMKRTQLRSKDLSKEVESYGLEISKKDQVELIEDKYKIILINKKPAFFYYQDQPAPMLKFLQENDVLKKITVDMGAVKFVINGADIMRPGIIEIEAGVSREDFVAVIDKNNKKPLAVGIALYSSEEMKKMASGKVIRNIHYVGDELWKMEI